MKNPTSTRGFRFVDLFAGIGGFHLALAGLGGSCVLASEIDDDCQFVYRRAFRKTRVRGDIRDLSADPKRLVPRHDVLCAGFPCQPFSKSGAQLGLRDKTRGTLFFDIMEIVAAHHPRFVILENVRNLAGPRHRETWDIIIRRLREENYRVAAEPVVYSPHMLPRNRGGRPQVRQRVFILAEWLGHDARQADLVGFPLIEHKPYPDFDPHSWDIRDYLDDDSTISDVEQYRLRPDEKRWIDAWQDFARFIDGDMPGFPVWVEALRDEPDLDPAYPEWRLNFHRKNSDLYVRHRKQIKAWLTDHAVKQFPASRQKFEWQAQDMDRNLKKLVLHFRPSGIRVRPPTYLPALVAINQTSIIGWLGRRITPREAARLQGFPEKFRLHPNPGVAYQQLGNAVNVGVARFAARTLFESSAHGWPGRAGVSPSASRKPIRTSLAQLRTF